MLGLALNYLALVSKNSFLSNFLKVLFYETYLILPCLQSLKRQVAPR